MAETLPKHYVKTLKNDLTVVAIPLDNQSGVATVDIFYRVGSRNEILGKSGIAHMLEHLNFKSSKNLKAGEFDEIVKSFGGVNNASTGFDYTHYFIKSSSSNMDKSLELFSELMQNLALKDEEFQPERDVVAEERRWRTDNNPIGYLYFNLFNNAFVYHPYHWTPIGFMGDIQNWKIEDIKSFHKTFYQPKNATIVVAGDIDEKKVFEASEKYFKDIENSSEIPEVYQVEPEQKGHKRIEILKESEVEMVALGFHIPDFKDKDQVVLSTISEVLSSGKSSRLNKKLIDEKQLVNQIYAYNIESIDPSLFLILAICNPDVKAEDVEKEILEELESLKKSNVSKDELDKVKINAKADFIFSMENSSNLVDMFGSYITRGDVTPLLNYLDDLERVESKDIKEIASKYFYKENQTTLILRKK